jgi:outer membrane lipoprotein-sorting protein
MRFSGRPGLWRGAAWLTPLAMAAAFVAAGPVAGALNGPASADLPARSAQQLLVDVQQADISGLSGTVQETVDLGLPQLPDGVGGSSSSSGLMSLLAGTHTMRVWHGGAKQTRIALPTQYGETDLVRNGSDVWLWTSADHTAQHWTIPARPDHGRMSRGRALSHAPATPQQAADELLKGLSPTTIVTGDGTTTVAGRSAYVLQLQPRTSDTLVSSVQIAIDGATHLPTQVQVFAQGQTKPSFSVGFTTFDPTAPDPSTFMFTPPQGATVEQHAVPSQPAAPGQRVLPNRRVAPGGDTTSPSGQPPVKRYGTGWSQVLVAQLPAKSNGNTGTLGELIAQLPMVSGTWGSGHLLQGPLLSVVLTADHRVAIGAVPPEQLYAALAR